ncbi:MAG: hypothetical protein ABIC68_08365 [Candidatus Omnitrophota bacterium]
MKDFKELIKFIFGFMPWILFLFFSGHTLVSLERAIIISVLASLLFGFRELRRGVILQWATLFFFIGCMIAVNLTGLLSIANDMGIIANGFLALFIWVTIFTGRPFTLQYARADLPKELWNDPKVISSCQLIAIVWAVLLTFSALAAYFRVLNPDVYPDGVYFDINIGIILSGIIFTTLYKRHKRLQR